MASKGVGDGDQSWWGEDEQDVQGKNGMNLVTWYPFFKKVGALHCTWYLPCTLICHMYYWNVLVY